MAVNPTIWLAFVAGLLSFISPCVLPLYPSYISYISGVSFSNGAESLVTGQIRRKALSHAIFFVLGFSVIFIALGASASLIGIIFSEYRDVVSEIGGLIVIVMGLVLMKVIKWDLFMREAKWSLRKKPAGYLGAFVVGISFSAGWTPCIGPMLASVIAIAATSQASGMLLMSFYAIGFALPFLILAYTLGSLRWLLKYSERISQVGGGILVLMGILLLTGKLTDITSWLTQLYGGYTGI